VCVSEHKDWRPTRYSRTMRFINLFLVGYFVLVIGVALGLWQAGFFNRVSPIWIGIGVLVAIGIGIMMAVSSGKPAMTESAPK